MQIGKVNFASYDAKTTYRILSDHWYKSGYGAVLYALGNKGLTWETTNTLDVGMEVIWKVKMIRILKEMRMNVHV